MNKAAARPLPVLLTAVLVALVVLLALSRQFYLEAMLSAFFASTLAGAAILHFAVAPKRDALPVAACALLLGTAEFACLHFPHGPTIVVPAISLIGLSSLLVFGTRTAWSRGDDLGLYLRAYVPAVLFVLSEYAASSLLGISASLHPKTLDLYLYSFDASLGVQLSFVAGRWLKETAWLHVTALIFYMGLMLPVALVAGSLVRQRSRRALPAIVGFLITGPLGILFYNILPACGPRYVFGAAFPFLGPTQAQAAHLVVVPIALSGPRNAIPSLHMAWALLAWWNSKRLPAWIRVFTLVFLVFTVVATLGTGEHYFVDLVAAFPFAVAVQAISDYRVPLRDPRRSRPLLGGFLMALGWMAVLSFAPPQMWWTSPAIGWSLVATTVLASLYLERLRSADAGQPEGGAGAEQPAALAAASS